MKIYAVRKEDDLYYQGPFWIVSDSFKDILKGNFEIVGEQYECDYNGNYVNNNRSKSQRTHKNIWKLNYASKYGIDDFTYFPRGRVSIYQGSAFIHLNSKCNIPKIIDKIIELYHIERLDINIDLNDTYQGSHYDFQLT